MNAFVCLQMRRVLVCACPLLKNMWMQYGTAKHLLTDAALVSAECKRVFIMRILWKRDAQAYYIVLQYSHFT